MPNYFPLSDGVTWVYAIEAEGVRHGRLSLQAGFVESKDGVVTAKMAHTTTVTGDKGEERSVKQILTYRKVADELSYVTEQGIRRIELKLPLEVGAAWMDNGLRVEAVATEPVTVPYKAFDEAIKITATNDAGTTSNWYADGYGLIKSEALDSKGKVLTFSLTDHRVFLFSEAREDGSNPVH